MKGTMMVYKVDNSSVITPLDAPPDLETLQEAVDGDNIEVVPFFTTIRHGSEFVSCVAFCGEHGKLRKMPLNGRATAIWQLATARAIGEVLLGDVLCGSVVVIIGDNELLEAL